MCVVFVLVIGGYFFSESLASSNGFKEVYSKIEGKGYHLQLVVGGEIDDLAFVGSSVSSKQKGDYFLEIKFEFPKEVYIDRYELAEAHRFGVFPSFDLSDLAIDLEKPSDSSFSRPFTLQLRLPVDPLSTLLFQTRIPFHLRYQPPFHSTEPLSQKFEEQENKEEEENLLGTEKNQKYRITTISSPHINLIFEEEENEEGNRKQIILFSSSSSLSSPLQVLTPIGLDSHRMFVTYGTLFATAIGSIILIVSILREEKSGVKPTPKKGVYRK